MRFARPAAAGLGVGMLAGFAVALVRPRPPATPPGTATAAPAREPDAGTSDAQTPTDTPASRAGRHFTGRVI